MIGAFHYVLRATNDDATTCGSGYGGLRAAIDRVLDAHDDVITAGIIERHALTDDPDDSQGVVIAVASRRPFLDLGERGKLWITREMTTAERVFINHFSDKLAYLDLGQTVVTYAYRLADLETTSEFERGFRGLNTAMRGVQAHGYGLIVRHIEGVFGEQVIAAYTATGYYFTRSADESERQTIIMLRTAMENYGELNPVLALDDPDARSLVLTAIHHVSIIVDPVEQARVFRTVVGHVPAHFLVSASTAGAVAIF